MAITLNTVSFNQDSYVSPNKAQYVSTNHTFSSKDILTLSRAAPKANGAFAGMAKSEAKRTKTVTLADGSKAEAIVYIGCSLPVGMAKADADSLRDDIADFGLTTSADELFWKHDINV